MFIKTKYKISIVLSFILVVALVGCSKPIDDGSSIIYEEVIKEINVYADPTTSVESDLNSSENQSSTSKPTSSNSSSSSDDNKYNDFSDNPILANPEDYRGTKIILALTVDPQDDGTDYVVSRFEQEYGIEVETIVLTHGGYNMEVSALIAANKAPTVGISNGDAPLYVSYFQPLDAAKINYNHPIWNQNTFKLSTYNNKPYLCDTVGSFWTELDIVVYSKNLLKKANCPTPEELDKAGMWNFDSFLKICKATSSIPGCRGGSVGYLDTALHVAGGAVYRVDSTNHMVNGIDAKTINAFKTISEAFDAGYLSVQSSTGLCDNTLAIAFSHAWALRTDGHLAIHTDWDDLGYYYLPAFEEGGQSSKTGVFRGYGVFKGCNDNPKTGTKAAVAGGLFLSEYLDIGNYDINRSFLSEDAKTFFFKVCDAYSKGENYSPYYTSYDLNSGISGLDDDALVYAHMSDNPSQIEKELASVMPSVQLGVDNLNKFIDQNIDNN